jgi:hypothetical protein
MIPNTWRQRISCGEFGFGEATFFRCKPSMGAENENLQNFHP